MNEPIVDARGKACPIPFMLAKKQIDSKVDQFIVLVDNQVAVENLKKLAASKGFSTETTEDVNFFSVTFLREDVQAMHIVANSPSVPHNLVQGEWVLLICNDTLGNGDTPLGTNLMRMFLYSLNEQPNVPKTLILMNKGVTLACNDTQSIQSLSSLAKKGVVINACGTCLDYYGLTDRLQVGSIVNMYEITCILAEAPKVLSL